MVNTRRHRKGGPGRIEVPVGLEKLLFHAARDAEFKKKLLEDTQSAIAFSKVKLRASELMMLQAIPRDSLERMIDSIVPQNPRRRQFMGLIAAATASLAAGTISSCDDEEPSGDFRQDDDDDNDDTDTDTLEMDDDDDNDNGGAGPDVNEGDCECDSLVGAKTRQAKKWWLKLK